MASSRNGKAFACLVVAFGMLPYFQLSASAQRLPDVPRPQTGGEWGQLLTPIGEIQGSLGPQPNMDGIGINIKEFRPLIEEELLRRIQQDKPARFEKINIKAETGLAPYENKIDLAEYEKRPLTLHDYEQLASKIGKQYWEQKQICRVEFSHDVDNVLEIVLKPIRLAGVKVEGSHCLKACAVQRITGIKPHEHLNFKKIETGLRILQDNPDMQVEAELEPVDLESSATLVLKPKAQRSFHMASFWSNLDQTYYGGEVTGISAIANNVTGNGDTLMVTAIPDIREHGVYTHYEIPLTSHGTRFGVDYSYMRGNPKGYAYDPYNIRGYAWGVTTSINQVLMSRDNFRLSTDLNFDVKQFRTKSDGILIERENMRDLRWGIQLLHHGENHEFVTRQEATVGIPLMGATPNSSKNIGNMGGASQFFRYIGSFNYLRNLPWNMAGVLNGVAQWSPGTLSSTDLGGIGGTYWGRGYPEAFAQADSLVYASGELRFPAFMIPKKLKFGKEGQPIRDKIQFLTFVDYAYAKVNNKSLVPDPTTNIASVGVGTRIELCKNVSGRFDLGIPLIRPSNAMMPINRYHPRIHFGIQINLF